MLCAKINGVKTDEERNVGLGTTISYIGSALGARIHPSPWAHGDRQSVVH